MKNFDISVIVPVYNAETHFKDFLLSIFSQEGPRIEYIFVNDASTDRSMIILDDVLNSFPQHKQNITILNNTKNSGTGYTRNKGLNRAKGEYFIQLDADDWIEKEALVTMFNCAKKNNADVVATDYFINYPSKEEYVIQNYSMKPVIDFKNILLGSLQGVFWNKLVKTELCKENNITIDENFSLFEDKLFCLKLFSKAQVINYIPKAFIHYRQHDKSVTSVSVSEKHIVDTKRYIESLKEFLKQNNIYENNEFDFFTNVQYHKKIFLIDKKYFKLWDDYYPEVNKVKYTLNIAHYDPLKKIVTILAVLGIKGIMPILYNTHKKNISK